MLADRVRMSRLLDVDVELEGYVLATDNDFSGTSNGGFRYIGSDFKIVIPDRIKGIAVTGYDNMFSGSSVIGVASYNKNVTSMYSMFNNSKATTLDLSSFDTSNVTDMAQMFNNSSATTLDLSSFDTSNVTDMWQMFYYSGATTLDLSSFDTSSVYDMSYMFYSCASLTSLDLSNFDTSKVTNMSYMFGFCLELTSLDLSGFDTSKVTNMSNMFRECNSITIAYARTQGDADKLNTSSNKPSNVNFVVK